ncbi:MULTISPECIES: TetR family transcriptional regulator [Actinopolyspora]|uniref:Helix-turn-helix domain of resolvase n=1 Tax=Actinopolyspora saharensis TaxID=995062 RepID=A0A1H0YS65_9ACTN|nr:MULTISPECIES: TetR family transcriptional regulator [Actinopolyspora]NHD19534.1 TetR family transcriptional regulator [Actinopolyspora sp. BKK2]NHE78690.1 TetR family transcriptional regulator [Actinopolyspora sp. BKK1]SDQ17993.1 Helix-turn-helix domain of resolvase [Actinopolyspora saharensis]
MVERQADTRTRILATAEQLFVERGYHPTTLQEIADRIGITKPALYHHFTSKAEILTHLLDPMTTELEQVLAEAARQEDLGTVRTRLMTGWVEIFLRYRGTLLALLRELASVPSEAFTRVLTVMDRAIDTAAGTNAGPAERVVLAQALSALTDPIALLPDLSDEALREHLLTGVWRLLGHPPASEPAHTHRARAGRPRRLSAADAELARELHASGQHSAEEIASRLGVSRATLYRHLRTGRNTI